MTTCIYSGFENCFENNYSCRINYILLFDTYITRKEDNFKIPPQRRRQITSVVGITRKEDNFKIDITKEAIYNASDIIVHIIVHGYMFEVEFT